MGGKIHLVATVILALTLLSSSANSELVVVDFDELTPGAFVTSQFDHVTFSSPNDTGNPFAGVVINASFDPVGNALFSNAAALADLSLEFDRPVENFQFDALEMNTPGIIHGYIDVYRGLSLLDTVEMTGPGGFFVTDHFDLSSLGKVTKIDIRDLNDGSNGGVVFDNFSFEVSAVPEPSSAVLTAVAVFPALLRRRRR